MSSRVRSGRRYGNAWKTTGKFNNMCHVCTVNVDPSVEGLAAYPEQVFINDKPLRQVASKEEVTEGTFFVEDKTPTTAKDPKNNKAGLNYGAEDEIIYYVGSDPTAGTTEISERPRAFTSVGANFAWKGIKRLPVRPRPGVGLRQREIPRPQRHLRGVGQPGELRGAGLDLRPLRTLDDITALQPHLGMRRRLNCQVRLVDEEMGLTIDTTLDDDGVAVTGFFHRVADIAKRRGLGSRIAVTAVRRHPQDIAVRDRIIRILELIDTVEAIRRLSLRGGMHHQAPTSQSKSHGRGDHPSWKPST